MAYDYELRIEPADEEGYVAFCPELNGLVGYGLTRAAAIDSFDSFKSDWFDGAVKAGITIPPPIHVIEKQFSGKFVVRIKPHLHMVLAGKAREEGVSLNALCERLLKNGSATPAKQPDVNPGYRQANWPLGQDMGSGLLSAWPGLGAGVTAGNLPRLVGADNVATLEGRVAESKAEIQAKGKVLHHEDWSQIPSSKIETDIKQSCVGNY